MKIKSTLISLLMAAGVCMAPFANAEKLTAGPMAGPSAMRSVTVWMQSDSSAKARLEYWTDKAPHKNSPSIELKPQDDFAGHITLVDLVPGTKYQYRVLLNNKPVDGRVYQLATQTLWQWRTDPPSSKVLLGSCAYINEGIFDRPNNSYGGGYEIFESMAAAKPDLTIWMGDNVYFREVDYDSPSGMSYRYRHDRALPQLQTLLNTGAHAAIWDDHDYGPNDSNSSFVLKADSLALFKRYWANPSYGLPDAQGVFTVVHHNDADFFMLDDRWYRDGDRAPESEIKGLFGERQLNWLKDALLSSTANFKIIVAGGQMLNEQNRWEGWLNFITERRKFLDWLAVNKVDGVMFASGDRHQTELFRMQRTDNYPLYELTCSPLTAGTHNLDNEQNNPMRVAGTLVGEKNFCSMEFSGTYQDRQMMVRSYGTKGEVLWERKISKQEISKPIDKK
jgi:alkaline phosphatase D